MATHREQWARDHGRLYANDGWCIPCNRYRRRKDMAGGHTDICRQHVERARAEVKRNSLPA